MSTYEVATGARATFAFTLTSPGAPVPDGDGGFTRPPQALGPGPIIGGLRPATAADQEHHAAGTVASRATRIVTLPYVPGVSTETVLAWTDRHGRARTANVVGVSNPDQRDVELVLAVVEAGL